MMPIAALEDGPKIIASREDSRICVACDLAAWMAFTVKEKYEANQKGGFHV